MSVVLAAWIAAQPCNRHGIHGSCGTCVLTESVSRGRYALGLPQTEGGGEPPPESAAARAHVPSTVRSER